MPQLRIAHLADVHLGYRAYNRVTRQGLNWREADVFNVFREAMAKVVQIQPDLVIIAGDLFHVVRPSNLCIEQTFREFLKFRSECGAPVVIIGGNHDSPRSAETGCIVDLLRNIPGVYVVHHEYRGIEIPEIDTTIFCLCHRAVPALSSLKLEPNPKTKYNVLTVHGTLEGIARNFYDVGNPIRRSQILQDSWDYIAVGHYHIFEKLSDNAYYSGSLEYTSFNIWQETEKPKGFIEFDVANRSLVEFHRLPTREVIDLRLVNGDGLSAEEINQLIALRVEGIRGGHQDKIVRLVVENVPRSVTPDLDYRTLRRIRAEALHFDLQLRPPKKDVRTREPGEAGTARPLEDEWREFAGSFEIPAGVDKAELTSKGLQYLADVTGSGSGLT
ncbi:MAG: exonuclease SbcCD subunit D [Armatimonadetes bacterium]|nr:exonuclease SbcCD subunit D [Armatimonadota bacterium]